MNDGRLPRRLNCEFRLPLSIAESCSDGFRIRLCWLNSSSLPAERPSSLTSPAASALSSASSLLLGPKTSSEDSSFSPSFLLLVVELGVGVAKQQEKMLLKPPLIENELLFAAFSTLPVAMFQCKD